VAYEPKYVAAYFDALGARELNRFDQSLSGRVSLALHTRAIERYVAPGSRVLDIGAGPGRFTEVLHRIGCRIVVADLSFEQLSLNRRRAAELGFSASVESWQQLDICTLADLDSASFDAVVAFGGPFSYVFDQRDRALEACRRVLRPGGILALSVMSVWGSLLRFLPDVLQAPRRTNRAIVSTGDITPAHDPSAKHHCHVFRAAELRSFLQEPGLQLLHMSASNAVSTGHDISLSDSPATWDHLLELEAEACVEPGMIDAGSHIIAVARHR